MTAFATACAVALGADLPLSVGVAAAALTGQLAVGWSNDALDAGRDTSAGRPDKPIARGEVGVRAVWTAGAAALVLCVPLSLRLGLLAGALHLVAVGVALAYNLSLKFVAASPVPFALAFGLLPVVTYRVVDDAWPPGLLVLGAVLLGAAAHFGNTIGDTEADRATGVRGLPQRLGPRASVLSMAGLLGAAGAVLLAQVVHSGEFSTRVWAGSALLTAGVALAATVPLIVATREASAWRLTLASVALVVLGFLLTV
ncbi:UbiA family prenyltransferase [Spongisporangium articulatum]|uniref:UbiA family prenyltransferase n=1 Tax=Spongisporangium articulatum TaxID=3362603 RepID=A0ABW8AI92_9ACTN